MENVTDIEIDFGPICRYCLSTKVDNMSVFDKCPLLLPEDSIANFVTRLTAVEVENTDGLPTLLCSECLNKIVLTLEFIQQVTVSESALRESFQSTLTEAQEKLAKGVEVEIKEEIMDECSLMNIQNKDASFGVKLLKQEPRGRRKAKKSIIVKPKKGQTSIKTNLRLSKRLEYTKIKLDEDKSRLAVMEGDLLKNYKDKGCEANFQAAKDLMSHKANCQSMHENIYKCMFCDLELFSSEDYTEHYKKCHLAKKLDTMEKQKKTRRGRKSISICRICARRFSCKSGLARHMTRTHKMTKEQAKEEADNSATGPVVEINSDMPALKTTVHLCELYICTDCPKPLSYNLITTYIEHQIKTHNKTLGTISKKDLSPIYINTFDLFSKGFEEDVMKNQEIDVSGQFKAVCKDCTPEVNFSSVSTYFKHMKDSHNRTFFRDGLYIFDGRTEYACDEPGCGAMLMHRASWKRHVRQLHGRCFPTGWNCLEPGCGQSFTSNTAMIRHGVAEHSKYFADAHNAFADIFLKQQMEDKRVREFECEICKRKFVTKNSLRAHIMTLHLKQKEKEMVECPQCGKMLVKNSLKGHIQSTHEKIKVPCPMCHKHLNYTHLHRHYARHLGKDSRNNKKYLCNDCGKILLSKKGLEVHQKQHTNCRDFVCNICGYGYTSEKILQMHQKIHDPARKQFPCSLCDRTFKNRETLSRHLLIHSGLKNYVCEICSKNFYTTQELNRHLRFHRKEYRFDCDMCDMRFYEKSRLRIHLMRHKNVRPHKCHMCDKMFTTGKHLARHMAVRHQLHDRKERRPWRDPETYVSLEELLAL